MKKEHTKRQQQIAIQGYEGSFHMEAARLFFGEEIEVATCDNFREVVKRTVANVEVAAGVMAIENSIAGSILPNYALLEKYPLCIVGEVYLQIRQNLMANPDVKLEDIREVHSHPMALLQSMDYLEKFPAWKLVETGDTALSAKNINQYKSKYQAAIASSFAAQLYNLHILSPDIQTLKNNYTRFLVIKNESLAAEPEDADKASAVFITDHSKGALCKALGVIADAGINLSKLQSMPIPGTDFQYGFHADMEFNDREQLEKVLRKLKSCTRTLKVFGIYKNGKKI